MGYTQEAIRGVSWMSAFRVTTRLLSFGKMAVLARVLSPAQFGVFGIASLILELLEMLTETGINIFLIQSKEHIDKYINSAWVVSIIRGIIISLCIVVSSPFLVEFFHVNEALPILLLISLVPFIRGFINPAIVTLQKDLRFHKEFWLRTSLFFIDVLITVVLAITTQSSYSLVLGLLVSAILEVILSFTLTSPRPSFALERRYFSEIFHKGKWVTIYGVFNYFAQQGDNIIVGKVMGVASLGIYQMAYKVSTLPISEVTDVISKVAFPVYTRIEGDRKRLQKAFTKGIMLITIITIPLGLIIFMFPKEITLLLLGPKWISAVEILRILALYGVLRAISGSASALFLAVGCQKYVTAMTFVRFLTLIITIFPLVKLFGLEGAAFAALFSVLVEIPVITYYIVKVFTVKS